MAEESQISEGKHAAYSFEKIHAEAFLEWKNPSV